MERYFAKRTEGDFSETQRIRAGAGHAQLVTQAYVACSRQFAVKDGRRFFKALQELLSALGEAGYTKDAKGWHVTGGKFVQFGSMTNRQIFATWASVQQTVAKWIWNLLPTNTELHFPILEHQLVFKANDVSAVMQLLFELLHAGNGRFIFDSEQGLEYYEAKVMKCLIQ